MEAIMQWGSISVLSVIAFAVGWKLFGFMGALLLAIAVCLITGILTVTF